MWLGALEGQESAIAPGDATGQLPGNQQGADAIRTIDELQQKWSALDSRWNDYLAGLTPESLDELVYRFSLALNVRLGCRRSDVLLHVCTHAHYTVAQLINMLRQLGVEKLPASMLIALARQEEIKPQ